MSFKQGSVLCCISPRGHTNPDIAERAGKGRKKDPTSPSCPSRRCAPKYGLRVRLLCCPQSFWGVFFLSGTFWVCRGEAASWHPQIVGLPSPVCCGVRCLVCCLTPAEAGLGWEVLANQNDDFGRGRIDLFFPLLSVCFLTGAFAAQKVLWVFRSVWSPYHSLCVVPNPSHAFILLYLEKHHLLLFLLPRIKVQGLNNLSAAHPNLRFSWELNL